MVITEVFSYYIPRTNNFLCNCLQEIHGHWGVHQLKKGHLTNMNTFLNNFWCNCLQEIHAHFWGEGGPLAKVGSSAKFGVVVFKTSILNSQGGPLVKVGLFAKLGVLVFKASLLNYPGGPSAKVCLSAKFCVPVFNASMLY